MKLGMIGIIEYENLLMDQVRGLTMTMTLKQYSGTPFSSLKPDVHLNLISASSKKLVLYLLFFSLCFLISSCSADLDSQIIAPPAVNLCENISYLAFINNTGINPEMDIILNTTIPDGFQYSMNSTLINYPGGSSNDNPLINGSCLFWNLTDIMGKDLNESESINLTFNLTTFCGATSGGRIQITVTSANESSSQSTDSIDINFPIMKLTKTPTVISAHRFDNVTYHVAVENTGTGPLYNVLVNDTLSSGLVLTYSTAGGLNWSYAKVEPGETKTENLSFMVNSCTNLVNEVNATWGCNASYCDQQYAIASILFVSKDPNLVYSINPDPIIVPYCGNQTVNVTLSNLGSDVSYVLDLVMEFSGMPGDYIVSNVTGATYYPGNTSFLAGDLVPGQTKYFTFDLGLPKGACSPSSGVIAIYPFYTDACGRSWTPDTGLISYAMDSSNKPAISVSKSGPATLYVGETGTYNLSLSYSAGSCAENISENVIVDYYPASFDVVQNGSGVVDTVNHTITWVNQTIEDGLPWSREIRLKAPQSVPCSCGNSFANMLYIVAMNDCCDCPLTGNSTVSTLIVCSNDTVFQSNKTATPATQENCRNITYKTTYTFNQTGNITWNDLNFTERGGNGQTFPDGNLSGMATFILNASCMVNMSITLGTPINLSFLATNCSALQDGDILEILVTLLQPSTGSFPEWSDLCIKSVSSGCPTDQCFHDAVMVNVDRSDFSLGMDLANIMESCAYYDFVLNLNKNGPWNGSNLSVSYNDTNFNYIGPANISGIANYSVPVASFEPIGSGNLLTWYLGDLITAGGTISFKVQKSCNQNKEVAADLSYRDNCGELQSGTFSGGPLILNKGSLYIDKTPELIFARDKNALWKIYLSNKGSGTTYNSTVFDTLESGLIYAGSKINGIADPANTTVSGQNITWYLGNLSPKQQVIIELNATIDACKSLNNHVVARWGCNGSDCQTVPDDSQVIGLEPAIVVSKHDAGVMDDCGGPATFTIQADVLNANAYNASVSELLPAGLIYVPGSYNVTGAVPTSMSLSGNPLIWNFDSPEGWSPGTTVTIKFNATVSSPCSFVSGKATASINYTSPCGSTGVVSTRDLGLTRAAPRLSIAKAPATSWFEKDSIVAWNVTVKNIRTATARNITLSDILPENTAYDALNSSPPANSGLGTVASPLIWNLADMPKASARVIKVAAKVTNCTVEKKNEAAVSWSCCVVSSAKSNAALRTLPVVSLSKTSGFIDTCGGDYTIVISNTGTTAHSPSIHDILPLGFIYKPGSANITSNNATHKTYLNTLTDEPLDLSGSNRSIIWNTSNIDCIYRGETITIKFSTESCRGCCNKVILPNQNKVYFNYTDSCANPYSKQFDLNVSPKLAVLKVEKTPTAQNSAAITWKINVSNLGNTTANNVTLVEVIEPGFSNPVVTPADGTITPDQPAAGYYTITWSGLTLGLGNDVFVRTITASGKPSGGMVNNVTVKGTCPNGCVYSLDEDVAYVSRVNVTKGDEAIKTIGDYANFTIEVEYWGSGESYNNSRIIDRLPAGLKYSSYNCSGCGSFSISGSNLTWDIGNFTGPRTVVINLSTIVENVFSNQNGTIVENFVESIHESPIAIEFSRNDTANVTVIEPDLAITKSVNKTSGIQIGDILKYTLVASHTSSSAWAAYDVNVSDVLPAGVSFLSYTSTPVANATSFSGQNVTWYYSEIPLAQFVTVEYLAEVTGPVIMAEPLKNDAKLNWTSTPGANPDERSGKNTQLDNYNRLANVTSNVMDTAAITKAPTGPDLVRTIGETVQYTISADLPLATARAVWVNDTLPNGLRFENSSVNITGAGTLSSVTITATGPTSIKWYFGDVNNSENKDIQIKFNATVLNVISSYDGQIIGRNSVALSWKNYLNQRKTTPSSTSSRIRIREPDLQIAKSANRTTAQIGDTVQYTLLVSNSPPSNRPAYDAVIADLIPPEFALGSYSSAPPANAITVAGQNISWLYDVIPLGSYVTLKYNATLISSIVVNDTVRNNATVNWTSTSGPNPDERYGAWTALNDYNKANHVDLIVNNTASIIKLPDEDRNASIGLPVNYTLLLNLPRATVLGVWVNDSIPVGLIYDNSTLQISGAVGLVLLPVIIEPPNDGTTLTNVSMYLGDVDNSLGVDVKIEFNATVADTAENRAGGIIEANRATLQWKDINGMIKQSTDISGILKLPAISVEKRAELTANYPNDNVTFIIKVTNVGETLLDPIFVSDHLPYGMEHVSNNMSGVVSGRYVNGTIAGPLYPGSSIYVEILARFNGKSYNGFENYVNASGTPPVGRDVWDYDNIPLPDIVSAIKIIKTADITNPEVMQNVTYTLKVTNTGNLTQEVIKVTDIMPVEMTYLSSNPPGIVGGNIITWANVGPLGPGNSTYLQIVMRFE